ncbi:MAG: peptide chain release factor 3 [Alphaproteobacteria bacterium]|nr:peptide chain release factor 3 [Alphaproteobacteria bacterium]
MSLPHTDRRTFAIISHPDAGKTTLTEKLLVAGGAIHLAGNVKARGEARRARSDWMKIEQERGISVTSSVMSFEHRGLQFNLLDTPGHEDFSEDTYRTLTAVDSAIMVIDAARGIESQTRKLFEVCRLRDIPIITFINKVDREGRDPFELLDQIQDELQLEIAPLVWPVGMGGRFEGCFDVAANTFLTTKNNPSGNHNHIVQCTGLDDPKLDEMVKDQDVLESARESLELAVGGYAPFDAELYREGHLTPVVFGSALRDFGIESLLDLVANYAPEPRPSPTDGRVVEPAENAVTGFIFKVQANMDKKHRDRIAFMRLCSGEFKRGMKLRQVRTGKDLMVHSPIIFLAQDREIAEEAGAGDVIGIPNHGTIRVGDTFTEGESLRFTGLPVFAPEILRRIRLVDTTRVKQLRQALQDLSEEGLVQIFKPDVGTQWIVGAIGPLQLDVVADRARHEYNVEIAFEPTNYTAARWLKADEKVLAKFIRSNINQVLTDRDGDPVYLSAGAWDLSFKEQNNEEITFLKTKELN